MATTLGPSLAVQWLRHQVSTAGSTGLIPDWEIKILHDIQHGQKTGKKIVTILGLQLHILPPNKQMLIQLKLVCKSFG